MVGHVAIRIAAIFITSVIGAIVGAILGISIAWRISDCGDIACIGPIIEGLLFGGLVGFVLVFVISMFLAIRPKSNGN